MSRSQKAKVAPSSAKAKRYDDPNLFWTDTSPFLKVEEAKNNLCLGLSFLFRTDSSRCVFQSSLSENEKLLAALVCSKNKKNVNLLPSPTTECSAAKILFNDLQEMGILVNAVIGEKDTVNLYRELIEETGKTTKLLMSQGIYRCTKVNVPTLTNDLIFRMAEPKDASKIGEWLQAFHDEAVPHDPPFNAIDLANSKIADKMFYVLEKNHELVSMAGWCRDIETSSSVNAVFTPKKWRNNGYASLVTAKLTELLLENGKKETNLYTDMTNPTSNKIYLKISYEFICHSIHLEVND